jgi:hypothetical protein
VQARINNYRSLCVIEAFKPLPHTGLPLQVKAVKEGGSPADF